MISAAKVFLIIEQIYKTIQQFKTTANTSKIAKVLTNDNFEISTLPIEISTLPLEISTQPTGISTPPQAGKFRPVPY
jgi:hypothetical protein